MPFQASAKGKMGPGTRKKFTRPPLEDVQELIAGVNWDDDGIFERPQSPLSNILIPFFKNILSFLPSNLNLL